MVDANQKWDVPQAIEWMKQLIEFNIWFIEEPVSALSVNSTTDMLPDLT